MFSASNTYGSPSSTVASAPTSYEPSLPASNESPSSPVISPSISALRRVRGEVAEVGRVPQRERGDGAVLDVLAHLVRRAEAGQCDLALVLRRRQVARRGRDADRGRARRCPSARGRSAAAPRSCRTTSGRRRRRRRSRRARCSGGSPRGPPPSVSIQAFWFVALADADRIAIWPASPICSAIRSTCDLRDALRGGLVDEQVAALGVGVGVEGDDLHAGVAGLVERVADRLGVVRRDDEPADALLGRGLDEAAPARSGCASDGPTSAIGAAELLDGLLAAARWTCRSTGCRGSSAGR